MAMSLVDTVSAFYSNLLPKSAVTAREGTVVLKSDGRLYVHEKLVALRGTKPDEMMKESVCGPVEGRVVSPLFFIVSTFVPADGGPNPVTVMEKNLTADVVKALRHQADVLGADVIESQEPLKDAPDLDILSDIGAKMDARIREARNQLHEARTLNEQRDLLNIIKTARHQQAFVSKLLAMAPRPNNGKRRKSA